MDFKKGENINGALLLEPTTVETAGRIHRAWLCRIHDEEIKIIKERDLRRRKGTRTPPIRASLNRIYFSYKDRCRKRNIFFELTVEEFHGIAQQNCSYCGKPPSNGGTKHDPYTYNGIDRKDNNRGYTLKNSIPCCGICNAIKSNLLSYDEMKAAMDAILDFRLKKKRN